ncbi:HTH domain-containing protein [Bacillus wiedmannii]|uniref:helix-turn-helix domain-containing protein n=1 Tax=Bacillus wiedmannii TaxID=1890302 RepID=UPI001C03472B|nr:helix-turn-helix domain-containing protein [Bacillus wiedmannii]QWH65962.1 HTH domain-containing protein [Bacillus wiedmannii]
MNILVSSLIYNKSAKRKIQILEILSGEQKSISSIELAKQINCSNRTITSEISELNISLPETWDIIGEKSRGYMLQKPTTDSLSPIIMSSIKDSMVFKILTEIFINKYYSLEKCSQILYINKSTLRSNLKDFEKSILTPNNLEFKLGLIKINGEEINIRFLYKAFFFSIEQYTNVISLPNDLTENINNTLNSHNVKIDSNLLKVIIYVSIQRIIGKHFADTKIKFPVIFTFEQSLCFNEIISIIEDYCMVNLPQDEIDTLNLAFFLCSTSITQQKVKTLKYLEKKNENYYQDFLKLVDMIISNNKRHTIKSDYLKSELCIYFYKLYVAKQYKFSMDCFYTQPDYLVPSLKEMYDTNHLIISKWNTTINENKFNENDISHLAQHTIHILYSTYSRKNVLFSFSGNPAYAKLANMTLKAHFEESINIHLNLDNSTKYDLIITNDRTTSYPNDSPVYFIHQFITKKDIQDINDLLFD